MALPHGLEKLSLGRQYNAPLRNWVAPPALQELRFGAKFNQSLAGAQLPDTLRALTLGQLFNHPIQSGTMPRHLEKLHFGLKFAGDGCRVSSFHFPVHLTHLSAGGLFEFICDLHILPNALTHLHLGNRFNWALAMTQLPVELRHLSTGYSFDRSLSDARWPPCFKLLADVDIRHDVQPTLAGQSSASNPLRTGSRTSLQSATGRRLLAGATACLAFWMRFRSPAGSADLPDGLETLVLGDLFRQDLLYVSLLRLTLGNCFPLQRHPLFWPPGLEELRIRQQFGQVTLDFVLPAFPSSTVCPSLGPSGSRTHGRVRLCCSRVLLRDVCCS